ncbi:alpha/beta hydrolase [Pseudoalteromonas denitrificans]|uniref:Pimeloyl-ACP methyl ester carboxylesterase n=1 Tax=Pseudoalteromonas denitrificans DSM 6059 TaxID=1123010 RepID=A0A1I1FNL1_9GAMM|nr:alpha/beta hydrolase [Pseudoalteromonas denitrificans]SFC00914.1 Pimeloyl-ACP methyl ester carboxylesterase [Pseudoalteromonas denitrificans DSM 6059]
MPKPIINFVHANGFPAASYNTFLEYIKPDYQIMALPQYGHNPLYGITHNWQYLVDELIEFVLIQNQIIKDKNQKVINVGHSFGGVISFMAACQRPDLFKGLIMLDPPAFTGSTAFLMKLLKNTRFIDHITPAGRTKMRRKQWPLSANMVNQFKHKALFKNFDPRCLADYAHNAIVQRNQKLELAFSAEVETDIFRNLPVNLNQFKNKLTIPATLIYAENGVCSPRLVHKFSSKNNINVIKRPNIGHMFPLEQPEETALLIKHTIKSWQ